ncbi:MAG: hypothetical protein BGO45_04710 [Microbacterium sp. 71-36]|uniref:hypothetical protein n=1 Tax=unclassified Microbacterium TaxID=2609290 RepID=UPI00086E4886|nr:MULTISPECIES: hypothetical protein [unclassified Microbacterium]MBN9210527.1 hypothetical protein [Microbacterium sp.]ODT43198.1 MAG: hypothetical protein ABS60_00155 [Microbacterium sp. SCN 71-17]OJV75801.1 MAG: hypothetical protein BGO45_04710 [Microbacterium sp. 71-36]
MSVCRFLAAATVVIVAVLLVPAALVPGVNSADLMVIAAPLVLVWICAPHARYEPPAGGPTAPTDVPHVAEPPAGPTP